MRAIMHLYKLQLKMTLHYCQYIYDIRMHCTIVIFVIQWPLSRVSNVSKVRQAPRQMLEIVHLLPREIDGKHLLLGQVGTSWSMGSTVIITLRVTCYVILMTHKQRTQTVHMASRVYQGFSFGDSGVFREGPLGDAPLCLNAKHFDQKMADFDF